MLKILEPITPDELIRSAEEDRDVVALLKENPSYTFQLTTILSIFPFVDRALDHINERWINYFIDNILSKERPDLYVALTYNGKCREWAIRQVLRVRDYLQTKMVASKWAL